MNRNQISRFKIMTAVLVLMICALGIKLFDMTIVKGDHYRTLADNKRIKEVEVNATRGNIYDRNGVLLAGTKASFSAQIQKDEINRLKDAEKNGYLLQLVRFLETEGASYSDDYYIGLNVFHYPSVEDYFTKDKIPDNAVMDAIIDNKLVEPLLRLTYVDASDPDHYRFNMFSRALSALERKGISLTVNVTTEPDLSASFVDTPELQRLMGEHNFGLAEDPVAVVARLIAEDRSTIRSIMNHPVARMLIYEQLTSKNLQGSVVLEKIMVLSDKYHLENKAALHRSFPTITLETDAKQDFVHIVTEKSLPLLLTKVSLGSDGQVVVPAEILIAMLADKDVESPVKFEVSEGKDTVTLSYTDGLEKEQSPTDALIQLAKEKAVLHDFITDDRVKITAQSANTELAINPGISVVDWIYTDEKDRKDLVERFKLDAKATAQSIFDKMKTYYGIDVSSDYETVGVLSLLGAIQAQGHLGYQPINVCYGLSEETVARIEESIPRASGIGVASVPIRHYPNGAFNAHTLGYIGKISTEDEVKRYIDVLGYQRNDLIGKTGVEESFETTLHGTNGKREIEVDSKGNTTRVISETAAIPGNNVYLSTDFALQKAMEDALSQVIEQLQVGGTYTSKWGSYDIDYYPFARIGASVAIDVNTGGVIAMASYPDYDPNLFSTGISESDWQSLMPQDDEDTKAARPLMNVALQTAIQPGSTFKLATSLIALEKGMPAEEAILDSGYVNVGDTIFGCWLWNMSKQTHGYTNVYEALMHSCNYYYYALALGENQTTGQKTSVKLTVEDMIDVTKKLGLNEPTGIEINIPKETTGLIPNPDGKRIATQNRLHSFLVESLGAYAKDSREKTAEVVEEDAKTISKWTDEETIPDRTEVINRLDEMGYYPEQPLNGEREGIADKVKYNYLNQAEWDTSDMLNVVIGQGQNAYTPIEMARFAAVFASDGYKNKTTIVKEVRSYDNSKTIFENEPVRERIELNNYDNLGHVRHGMKMAANFGNQVALTGKLPTQIGVKTGTATIDGIDPNTGREYDEYGWYVAFAPYDNPQIAVATVVFQSGSGSMAGLVSRDVIGEFLTQNGFDDPSAEIATDEVPVIVEEEGGRHE